MQVQRQFRRQFIRSRRRAFKPKMVTNDISGAIISNAGTASIITTSFTPAAGALGVMWGRWTDAGNTITATISDTQSNTWYPVYARFNSNGMTSIAFYCDSMTNAATVVTIALSASAANSGRFDSWTGAKHWYLQAVNKAGFASGTAQPLSSGNITTINANELMVAALQTTNSETAPTITGFTLLADAAGRTHTGDQLTNSIGTFSASASFVTAASVAHVGIVAFTYSFRRTLNEAGTRCGSRRSAS